MTNLIKELQTFLDDEGRLTQWPSARNRKAEQGYAVAYLIQMFDYGRTYTEREVNAILNDNHTFNDPALLRRELFSRGLLGRLKDGSQYWRIEQPETN